jgi:hypothetical protein
VNVTDEDQQRLLDRPIEEDTLILFTRYHRINQIPFLIEQWNWEGIHGSTAVFLNKNVAGMTDTDLQRFSTKQAGIDLGDRTTIVRNENSLASEITRLIQTLASNAHRIQGWRLR